MDTSPQYIRMCDCEEIQGRKPQGMINSVKHWWKGIYQYEIDSCGEVRYWDKGLKVWLPRQDQLQAMAEQEMGQQGTPFFWLTVLRDFAEQVVELPGHYRPASMEQLWLSAVMSWLHQKRWDGKTWTEEGWEE